MIIVYNYLIMQEDNVNNKPRVLVAVTGSVAAIRVTEFIKELLHDYEVKLILTESVNMV